MIRTFYDVQICIDEQEFNLRISEPDAKARKALKLRADASAQALETLSAKAKEEEALNREIARLSGAMEINRELIAVSSMGDKLKLLLENKELSVKLANARERLAALAEDTAVVSEMDARFEEDFKFKSGLLIGGADAERFLSYAEDRGVSHRAIWDELNKAVANAQEKK